MRGVHGSHATIPVALQQNIHIFEAHVGARREHPPARTKRDGVEVAMTFVDTIRDFCDGLTRGLGLFLRERNDMVELAASPRPGIRARRAFTR
jgi:hypothetical protein